MAADQNHILRLQQRLDAISTQHRLFAQEIEQLRREIASLTSEAAAIPPIEAPISPAPIEQLKNEEIRMERPVIRTEPAQPPAASVQTQPLTRNPLPAAKTSLEKFIGENLINKIGIIITVIGVAIGAKYAMDHQLVSPLTRIVSGYIMALGLLGFAFKLKEKYHNFSAVLLSGAMAIMYFITFTAYSFYDLLPQSVTFLLMVLFTVFTVLAALHYNRQVIAQIGLVGAYAVPFLLSDGSGKVAILFSYMALINIGILIIGFKRHWKPLYYSSFALTWLIYGGWFGSRYEQEQHLVLALLFSSIFFITFYLTFLGYKLLQHEKFRLDDVFLLLVNTFVFYGFGYAVLEGHPTGNQLLGLFTVANAVIHFLVCLPIYKSKEVDKDLFLMMIGLVLLFVTIAVPIQLDGNWVTLLWIGEACLLFWIGRTRSNGIYEMLSYPVLLVALLSLFQDWQLVYGNHITEQLENKITPLLNVHLLSSLLFTGALLYLNYLHNNKKYLSGLKLGDEFFRLISKVLFISVSVVLYITFFLEISNYFTILKVASQVSVENTYAGVTHTYWQQDPSLNSFENSWLLNYTMLFLAALSWLNLKKLRNQSLAGVNLVLNLAVLLLFLTMGLYELSYLRGLYLHGTLSEYFTYGPFCIILRYIMFALAGAVVYSCFALSRSKLIDLDLEKGSDLVLHLILVWIASSELLHWMDMAGVSQSHKLALSILWGLYALFLIALGIGKKQKHLRLFAMALFALTLVKLFFYDIVHLDTLSKTIVLVSLGILLLITSFLYNKYKHIITEPNEVEA